MGGERPDVLMLQECGSWFAVRRFARRMGMDATSTRRGFARVRNAVLFRAPWRLARGSPIIQELTRHEGTMRRGFIAAGLRSGGIGLTAVSVHLGLVPREREHHARELTDFIAYGPVNPAAYEGGLIPKSRLQTLATAPENAGTSVFSNADWWVKNGEAAQKAFDEMMNR